MAAFPDEGEVMADPFGDRLEGLDDVSAELERIGELADGVGKALSRAFAGRCSTGAR